MTCYCNTDFKTGKALREAVKEGVEIKVRELTPSGARFLNTGRGVAVCGPWYPAPHKWYAQVDILGGRIVRVLK